MKHDFSKAIERLVFGNHKNDIAMIYWKQHRYTKRGMTISQLTCIDAQVNKIEVAEI